MKQLIDNVQVLVLKTSVLSLKYCILLERLLLVQSRADHDCHNARVCQKEWHVQQCGRL